MSASTAEITKLASNIFSCASRGLGFTIIVFLTTQYFKQKSNHRSAYYVILNVGYAVDFMLLVEWLIPLPMNTYYFILIIMMWYIVYFTTIWNFVLCLNRCTALAYLVKYDRIWRPFTMFFVVVFMLAFPFIVDGYTLFFNSNCYIQNYVTCASFRTSFYLKGSIVNVILNSIGILLITISMYKSSHDKFRSNSIHAKTERKLIYQAIFSSLFQLMSFTLKYFTATNSSVYVFMTFMYVSDIIYHVQHLVIMGTHFLFSPTFKIAYLEFYHLKILLPKRSGNSIISVKSSTAVHGKHFASTASAVVSVM